MMKKRAYQSPKAEPEFISALDILTLSVGKDNDMKVDFGDFDLEKL